MDGLSIGAALVISFIMIFPAFYKNSYKNRGTQAIIRYYDPFIEKPSKRLPAPKFIQIWYNIGKKPINIITYLSLLVHFASRIMIAVLSLCLSILKDRYSIPVIGVFMLLFMAINLPMFIAVIVCIFRVEKKKKAMSATQKRLEKRSLSASVVKEISDHRETTRMLKELKEYETLIAPFSKEFGRCLDKKKGVKYITDDNLKWAQNKIFPKYEKKLSYSISGEDPKNRSLTVRSTRNDQVIVQVPIKKS